MPVADMAESEKVGTALPAHDASRGPEGSDIQPISLVFGRMQVPQSHFESLLKFIRLRDFRESERCAL